MYSRDDFRGVRLRVVVVPASDRMCSSWPIAEAPPWPLLELRDSPDACMCSLSNGKAPDLERVGRGVFGADGRALIRRTTRATSTPLGIPS